MSDIGAPKKEYLPARAGTTRDRTWERRRFWSAVLLSDADLAAIQALRPRCAICQKPVDEFGWIGRKDTLGLQFYAKCHNNTEEMLLGLSDVEVVLRGGVQGAEAFRPINQIEAKSHEDREAEGRLPDPGVEQ